MSTETPRTDEAELSYDTIESRQSYSDTFVPARFARNLELENTRLAGEVKRLTRERDEAIKERDILSEIIQCAKTPMMRSVMESRDTALAQLAQMREAMETMAWDGQHLCDNDGQGCSACELAEKTLKALATGEIGNVLDSSVNPPHPAPPNGIF